MAHDRNDERGEAGRPDDGVASAVEAADRRFLAEWDDAGLDLGSWDAPPPFPAADGEELLETETAAPNGGSGEHAPGWLPPLFRGLFLLAAASALPFLVSVLLHDWLL